MDRYDKLILTPKTQINMITAAFLHKSITTLIILMTLISKGWILKAISISIKMLPTTPRQSY